MKRITRTNTRHIAGEDTDLEQQVQENKDNIATNTANIAGKQDTITNSTDLVMDQLNVGSNPLQPGSSVITRMFVDTEYTNTSTLGNGFGNAIQFRFNRGTGLNPSQQGKISCYFKSGANSTAPYGGMKLEAIDDNTMRTLLDIYHQAPPDDGECVMMVGQDGEGDVYARRYLITENTNNDIGGYYFGIEQQTSGTVNLNTTTDTAATWTKIYMDTGVFTIPNGTGTDTRVRVKQTGVYEISFNLFLTSTNDRVNPWIRLTVNGGDTGYGAMSYIRNANGHNQNCWVMSPVLYTLNANEDITITGSYEGFGATGPAYIFNSSSPNPTVHSHLRIKRIV